MMKKSIAITVISFVYILALFMMFFIDAGALGGIYSKAGIGSDDILHVAAFFILALLLRATFSSALFDLNRPILGAVIGAVLIAAIVELVQIVMATRHAEFYDFGLHLLGIAVYGILDYILERTLLRNLLKR